jgi:hypothetical protein
MKMLTDEIPTTLPLCEKCGTAPVYADATGWQRSMCWKCYMSDEPASPLKRALSIFECPGDDDEEFYLAPEVQRVIHDALACMVALKSGE